MSGYIYLEEGEELRVIVAKADRSSSVGGNEIAVNSFVIKQYDSYTLPETQSGSGGDTPSGVCVHFGGNATCTNGAVCEACGAEYGSFNPNNHTTDEIVSTITDITHKTTHKCCGAIVIEEGYHVFGNGKCRVCEFVCDHDGYVKNGKCTNCGTGGLGNDAPDSGDNDANKNDIKDEVKTKTEDGLPEIVIYIIVAVVALVVGGTVTFLITKRSLKK